LDTVQFPNNVPEVALALYHILQGGGFTTGGMNFDAKLRRQSLDAEDLVAAHVGGIDTLARGLLAAEAMIADGGLGRAVEARYAGWKGDLGRSILSGGATLESLAARVHAEGIDPQPVSGQQERLENWVNRFV
jgi:xylose isomerase